jgi:hypothetical protein
MRISRMGSSCLAGAAIAALATVADTVSAAAASPAAGPVTANPSTLIITVHFSPFQALHLKPKPDLKTGFGSGDKLTFHDPLFSHARQAGDEGGSCLLQAPTTFIRLHGKRPRTARSG